MFTAAVITVSDRSFRGERPDLGGPAVAETLEKAGYTVTHREIVPDEQPLIENAFEHGIRDMKDTGVIAVSFEAEGNRLSILVDDNGPNASDGLIERTQAVLDEDSSAPMGDSVALSNIHRRIRILYGPGSGLYVSRSPLGGFRSEIRMIGEKKYASADDR